MRAGIEYPSVDKEENNHIKYVVPVTSRDAIKACSYPSATPDVIAGLFVLCHTLHNASPSEMCSLWLETANSCKVQVGNAEQFKNHNEDHKPSVVEKVSSIMQDNCDAIESYLLSDCVMGSSISKASAYAGKACFHTLAVM